MPAEDEEREQQVCRKMNELRQKIAPIRREAADDPSMSDVISFDLRGNGPIMLEAVERLQEQDRLEMISQGLGRLMSPEEVEQLRQEIGNVRRGS